MKLLTWKEPLGRPECPYMVRWVLNLGPLGSIRLHHWWRSDDRRAKHDHPADFVTLVLKGSYDDLGIHECWEEYGAVSSSYDENTGYWECDDCGAEVDSKDPESTIERMWPGKVRRRRAEHRHTVSVIPPGCWTLLYFFPDRRKWGFWVRRKLDGRLRFMKSNKYFFENGHHPCDQP